MVRKPTAIPIEPRRESGADAPEIREEPDFLAAELEANGRLPAFPGTASADRKSVV